MSLTMQISAAPGPRLLVTIHIMLVTITPGGEVTTATGHPGITESHQVLIDLLLTWYQAALPGAPVLIIDGEEV